jgi:large conductance mechanosensitive channel
MKKFFQEFRDFAARGNVFDMAVGVVLATAFGKITSSLVNDLLMPLIGWLCGGIDLGTWNVTLRQAVVDAAGTELSPAVTLGVGAFLTTVIDFVLIAFAVFLLVKAMNRAMSLRKKPKEPEAPKGPTQEELLTQIRDLLQEEKKHDA